MPEGLRLYTFPESDWAMFSAGDMQSPDYECGIWVPVCKPVEQDEYEAAENVSTMLITGIL